MTELDPRLVYPAGSPEDTAGPDYSQVVAGRDAEGRWLHPLTGEPVDFPVTEPDDGRALMAADLLRMEQEHRRDVPAPDQDAPAPVEPDAPAPADPEGYVPPRPDPSFRPLDPPGNVDDQGRAHFLNTTSGDESCGGCGEPWPCPAWLELTTPEHADGED